MKKILFLMMIAVIFSSCEKILLGADEENNPENNFELLWNDFDQHYGLFEARGWDWDSIYTEYRPQITNQTTDMELWVVFKKMLGYLDDGHVGLYNNGTLAAPPYDSGSEGEEIVEQEFSQKLLESKYIEDVVFFGNTEDSEELDVYFHGKVKGKNIGYIYLKYMDTDPSIFDEILEKIGGYDAIIFDIRNNGGGEDIVSAGTAGRFADGEHFIYTVQVRDGLAHSDFTEKVKYFSKPIGQQNFSKPVVLLTDQITVSAADIFTLHMKSFPKVTQIGTTTAGDYSDLGMRRYLPNGWKYHYSNMMYLLPSGKSLDGIGSIPNIYVKNTIDDIKAKNDKVIERAFQFLFEEYGIE